LTHFLIRILRNFIGFMIGSPKFSFQNLTIVKHSLLNEDKVPEGKASFKIKCN